MFNKILKVTMLGFLICVGGLSASNAQFEVNQGAKQESVKVDAIPFVVALRKIVPVDYDFSFDTKEDLGQTVSYEHKDNWEDTLSSLLSGIGLMYRIDNQVIYISGVKQEKVETKPEPVMQPVAVAKETEATPVVEASKVKAEVAIEKTKEEENVNYIWKVRKGFTLQEVIKSWGEKVGWNVIWDSDKDYDLQSEISFTGSFVEATSELIEAFAEAQPPVTGTFYKNNTLVIKTISNGEVN